MGCCPSASGSRPLPKDLASASRDFFGLGECPVTVTCTTCGSALDVQAAGLDQSGLLPALEAGFLRRRFRIVDGVVYTQYGLFHGTFRLKLSGEPEPPAGSLEEQLVEPLKQVAIVPLRAPETWSAPLKPRSSRRKTASSTGPTRRPSQASLSSCEIVTGHTQEDLTTVMLAAAAEASAEGESTKCQITQSGVGRVSGTCAQQIAKLDQRAVARGAVIRATLCREYSAGLRTALHKVVEYAGLRVVMARLSTVQDGAACEIRDTLWLAARDGPKELFASVREALTPWLADLVEKLEGTTPTCGSPRKDQQLQVSDVEAYVAERAKTLSWVSSEELRHMPACVRAKAKQIPYGVQESADGHQCHDRDKFVGAGMNRTHRGADVLEFSTFFARGEEDSSVGCQPLQGRNIASQLSHARRSLSSALGMGDSCAEFVTQYDPVMCTLTIFKVFLNGVLPKGQRWGARTVAEQLCSIPVLELAGSVWDGAAAVRGLQQICLCDVVNWNTYCLLSMVGRTPDSELERWLLTAEAAASKINVDDLPRMLPKDVFKHTALGKLVVRVMEIWRSEGPADLAIEDVTVDFSEDGKLELVHGELRNMMDVTVFVRSASGAD